jgi:hypothetical protein
LLIRLRGYLINVGAENFGFGRKIAARRRFFRRPQQFTEPIGVLYFADILPGQVAKAIKAKKRIYRPVLNRGRLNAESSFQFSTEPVQFQNLISHVVLSDPLIKAEEKSSHYGRGFRRAYRVANPTAQEAALTKRARITPTVLKRAATAAPCA